VALEGVSFAIPKNSIFGLLGPNGAGKTSLIRIINQITAADQGEILFNGAPITREMIGHVGYLPEERGLYKKMKVGEQLLYLTQLKGIEKAEAKIKIKAWLDKFEIAHWVNKRVEELSKGMQQKIQFILTVLHEPELLILDEPFTGFDPINTELIKSEILALKAKGVSVIFSTHNMSSVEEICDEIALIDESKVVLNGSVSEIKQAYKDNIYEITFNGHMVAFANSLWTSARITSSNKISEEKMSVRVKVNKGFKINDIIKAVINKVEIESLNEVLPSLNEIFIKTVSKVKPELNEEDKS
jgi:ABC-2 type transport system ATP-binding protein